MVGADMAYVELFVIDHYNLFLTVGFQFFSAEGLKNLQNGYICNRVRFVFAKNRGRK